MSDNRVVLRRALSMLPWLLAGLIISLAVAWSMPWLAGNLSVQMPLSEEVKSLWRDHAPYAFPAEPQQAHTVTALGSDMLSMFYNHPGTNLVAHIQRDRVGWPLRSLESWMWNDRLSSSGRTGLVVLGDRLLPARPLWLGLAVNAVVFALGFLVVFRVSRHMRGVWRLHRSLCNRCAYPTGTNDRCTECGTPLPAWSRDGALRSFVSTLWHHQRVTLTLMVLSAGALATVGSAIALAFAAPLSSSPRLTLNDPQEVQWVRSNCTSPAMERLQDVRSRATFGLERLFVGIAGEQSPGSSGRYGLARPRTYVCRYRAGWPMYALEGVDWVGVSEPTYWPKRVATSADALFLPRRGPPSVIPLRPTWPGFVVNTLAYSALIAVGVWLWQRRGSVHTPAEGA